MPVRSIDQQFSIPHDDRLDTPLKTYTTPSYFLCATWNGRFIRHIHYVKIQPNAGDSAFTTVPMKLDRDECIQDFQLDEVQNLLAVVTTCESRPRQVYLRLMNFPSGRPHLSASVQPSISIPFKIGGSGIGQVQINQDWLGILLYNAHTLGSHFVLLDWETSKPIVPVHTEVDRSLTHFSFISPSDQKIVTTNMETFRIEVWMFDEKSMQKVLSLEMPGHAPGIRYSHLESYSLKPEQLDLGSYSPENTCVAFQLLLCTALGPAYFNGTTIVVTTAYLLEQEAAESMPWNAWGPRNAQLLETSQCVDGCNTGGPYYIHQIRRAGTRGIKEDTEHHITIYDIGQVRRAPRVSTFLLAGDGERRDVYADLLIGNAPRLFEPTFYLPCRILLNQGRRLFALNHDSGICSVDVYRF